MRLELFPIHVFRQTPQVSFFDAGIKESNGSTIVIIHHENAIAPTNDGKHELCINHYQIDHKLGYRG